MNAVNLAPEDTDAIVFRPSKKRKIYRQRALDGPDNPVNPTTDEIPSPTPVLAPIDDGSSDKEYVEAAQVSVSEILRLRTLRKHRAGGVEFRASAPTTRGYDDQEGALVLHENGGRGAGTETQPAMGPVRRFAKQTGMVGDVDKHMMAYIDSELAKSRLNATIPTIGSENSTSIFSSADSGFGKSTKGVKQLERQPATLGKLLEIDLGNEARDRNVVRTEQARRRLDGEDIEDDSANDGKPKKIRLGRDGKPWRDRKRRTSEDIRRDQLVEDVLRENRLDMYEEPQQPIISSHGDGEADDRIAEAFRREFMDAVSARQRKKPVPAPPARGPGGKKEEEVMKGPKLGGSRSARAAMREAQLKEMKAGKK